MTANAQYVRAYRERARTGQRSTYWNALTPDERLWMRVQRGPGCWIFTGRRDRRGYGLIDFQGHRTRSHRLAWILTNGPVPDGLEVCHSCDNPPCVRPDHLFIGTRADNMADMAAKGRHYSKTKPHLVVRGERSGQAKLTARDVAQIRTDYVPRRVSYPTLALRYGVHPGTIAKVVRGDSWSE